MTMNKWVRIISIGVISGVVTGFLLILAGFGTSSVITSGGEYVTFTTVKLDVNSFALLMIVGVSLAVIIVSLIFEAVRKNP